MQDRRFDVDVDQDLLESFAESLSSMDYTTLCIMNHKSREENDKNVPMLHNYDVLYPDERNLLFHGNSLDNIERMHWHYIDGSNESLRNLYDANVQPPSQMMIPVQQSHEVSTKSLGKISTGRTPSAAAKQRRRERNKVLARRTRVKKKVEMETLRDCVVALMKENAKIRSLISEKLPIDIAAKSLESSFILPENILNLIEQLKSSEERNLCNEMKIRQSSFCVVSTTMIDNPIIFASQGFYDLTGYNQEQIIGRNCRLLQGPDTDKNEIKKIRDALSRREDITSILLNYHQDGSTFLNRIEITHLKDINGDTPYIVGLQYKVTENQQQYFNDLNSATENNLFTTMCLTTTAVAGEHQTNCSRSSSACTSDHNSSGTNSKKNKKNIKTKIKLINVNASKSSGSTNNSLNGSSNNNGISKTKKDPCFRRISGTTSPTDSSGTANSNKILQQQQQTNNNSSNNVKATTKINNNNKSSSCSNSTTNKSTSNESNSGINSEGGSHISGGCSTNSHSDEGECCGIDKSASGSGGEDNNATGYGSNSEPSMENPFEL